MSNLNTSTLRPGLLVSLKTTVRGNVRHIRTELESEHRTDDGAERARWETERVIADPEEHEAATKVRGKAGSIIRSVCSPSTFGLLCPESAASELELAVASARKLAAEFNATAKLTNVSVYVITGRVAQDDVEAVRAINSELRDLLQDMESGVRNLDVKVIREAANKAKSLGGMLSVEAAARVQVAIDGARRAARTIVAAGETAAVELDRRAIATLVEARTSFLDLDEVGEVAQPVETGRAFDFEPGETDGTEDYNNLARREQAREIEMGE